MKFSRQILIGISIFLITKAYSQNKDSNIVFLSKSENIYNRTNGLLSNINLIAVKFANQIAGIQFILTTNRIKEQPSIRTDSIILQSGDKFLTLNKLYADTIYWRKEGDLFLSSILILNQKGIDFLKEYPIEGIILVVDEKPLFINIAMKSQRKITAIANGNY